MKFCVIGLGYFGRNLALSLSNARAEVLAVDNDPDKINAIKDDVSHAIIVDAAHIDSLTRLPLAEMDAVIVAIGEDFRGSLLTIGHLQALGVKRIVARIIDPVHERLLRLMKIEELIHPEAESAQRMAGSLVQGVMNRLDLTGGFAIVEAKVPTGIVGLTLQEAGLRKDYHLNLVTVRKARSPETAIVSRRSEVELIGVPPADYAFEADDVLVLFGQQNHIDRFLAQ